MIVVTGGAGYIGRYVVQALRAADQGVMIVDDLRTGHRDALDGIPHLLKDIATADLDWSDVTGVVHLAASSIVEESVRDPEKYRRNNLDAAICFLEPAVGRGIPIVLSSTAAVYGEPERVPIPEDHPTRPLNPYGETKLDLERWLLGRGRAAVLRYFNAAGGFERHEPETHLIPRLLSTRGEFPIYGNDYPTPDGTCIRDFVHVEDLARAHVLALGRKGIWNLGSGTGHSVLDVVRKAGRTPRFEPRRPGDPAVLVADTTKAKRDLGWEPRLGLMEILATARI